MSEIKNIQLPDICDFDEVEVIEILVSVGDTILSSSDFCD
jgi:pyruvate dehydrogenase E2 component (dihydrolipoamide acetyltransferase)